MVEHRTIDYNYGGVIFHLRIVQLVVMPIMILALALGVESFASLPFLFPLIFVVVNLYLVFMRCFDSVDGRYDFRSMLGTPEMGAKIEYACDLYLPCVLAILAHFTSPVSKSSFTSLVFSITDYLALDCAIATAFVESYEGHKLKYI